MNSRNIAATLVLIVGGALAVAVPAGAAPPGAKGGDLEVYVGQVNANALEKLKLAGLDHEDIATEKGRGGKTSVEVVMSNRQADKLAAQGVDLSVKRIDGQKASTLAAKQNAAGYEGFRSYSEDGGIADELRETAAAHPDLAKLVPFGNTVQGQEMLAVKVTKGANTHKDGLRPAVMYLGAQHAREWITPEMIRRLMHHYIDGYGSDPEITEIVDTTELWFVPVANPDGYDYTFTDDHRLWRKNLADNDGDGVITGNDGVDPNRNYATKWGWDNEGSSPNPSSQTFRGSGPNSEPESQALDSLFGRVGFEQFINYHSAAELLLYGIGWQVSTPSPDDVVNVAMAGTDGNSAVPGYDPDISAELYTTNGDTDSHMTVKYDTLGFTPEMTTCEVASDKYADDEWRAEDCVSGFNFPDDDRLITEEFEKNIPFALSVAHSAQDPADPVTFNGDQAPDLVADEFAVSHGTDQPVAVTADRQLENLRLNYRVNGGAAQSAKVSEWGGGKRYGDTNDDYYGEFRGRVTGTSSGDEVAVWFSGVKPGEGPISTDPFTYEVAEDIGGDVLVLAAEDYTGISPAQGVSAPKYADEHVASVEAAGHDADVYDIDANGRTAPHHLGVLAHYDAVVWESGDDIVPRAPGQVGGTADDVTVQTELAVRDYLNEGGKLLAAGQYNRFAEGADGSYWYSPNEPPGCTTPGESPCLPLLNDFQQYWLGAHTYVSDGGTDAEGNPYPVEGVAGGFAGFGGDLNAPGSAENQGHTASFLTTSGFLPPAEFPQFDSSSTVDWVRPGGAPYDPHTGDWYAYSQQADASFKRLSRTVDLTGASSGKLDFATSYDLEGDWDYQFVEVRGADGKWTTLPDANGHTSQATGESCASGWDELHPHLTNYQGADCSPTGTTGEWNAATGNSNGWQDWSIDLSAYADQQVEVSISYASDWGTQGLGSFIDDTSVVVDGVETATSFETDLGGWTVSGAPAGSEPNNNDWQRDQLAFDEGAVVVTDDTVYAGFGAEGLAPTQRDDFIARSLNHLLG